MSIDDSFPRGPGSLDVRLARQGSWLFRYRSYLPVPYLLVLIALEFLNAPTAPRQDTLQHYAWEALCVVVGFAGIAIRVWVGGQVPGGTSGRNTRGQLASELNTTGPYSLVRHPLYIGNFLMWLGVALFTQSALCVALAAALYVLVYERIALAEEAFLRQRFGEQFDRWAARTAAVLPRFRAFVPSALPFSWRTALRREYSGLLGFVLALAALEVAEEAAPPGAMTLDLPWKLLVAVAFVTWLTLRFLKRHTRLLRVAGR